jgi:hypothetical protein
VGLFSSLFGDGGHSQSTTSTSNVTNTQLAGGAIQAPVTYGTGNRQTVNVIQTDQGAVMAATDISDHAIALGIQEAQTGSAVAIAGLAHAQDAYTTSLALVGAVTHDALNNNFRLADSAIASTSRYAGKALDSVTRFSTDTLNSNGFIAGKALDDVSNAYAKAQSQTAGFATQTLQAVESLAAQTTQSNQQSTDQTLTKIATAAALAVVAIMVFRK